jgi:hypothetical protein
MTRPRFSYGGSGRSAIALSVVGMALASIGSGCGSRAGGGSADPADAAVTFQSALTSPATWNSLYGSWPGARYDHGMTYDSDLKRIVVFGGREAASGPYYGDLWEYDTVKGAWNQRTPGGCMPATTCPFPRSGASLVYDTMRKKTILFGGWQPGAGFYDPDQWEWDGSAQTWTLRQNTTQPSARYGAAMVWDSQRNVAVLFGGFDEATGRRQDTWEWNGTTWMDRTPAGTKPTPRHSAKMIYDSQRGKAVLYSGNTGNGAATGGTWVDELWEWDGAAGTWTKITATALTSTQYGSGYSTLVYDASTNKIVLFYSYSNGYTWVYTPGASNTGTWATAPDAIRTDTSTYPPYYFPGIVYDSGRQVLVFFGGQGYGRTLWDINTTDWTWTNRSAPANGPIQRQYPSIAFDSMRGKLMVFGGRSSVDSGYKNDIYEWSGVDATLTNRTTGGTKPDVRYQAAMVYDSKRDRLLMFGGYGTMVYDDLWAWAPTTREWTQISFTGTRPTARYGHWMFYDPVRDKVYVYGLNQGNYQIWEYDPALNKWLDRTVTSPPAGVSRSYFDVAFDSTRGKIMEIGGNYGGAYTTDIWEWDTTTGAWAQAMPATGSTVPDGRYYHTVAYDSIRRVVLMVGGHVYITGKNTQVNDSWEWDPNLGIWTETTPVGVKPQPREQHLMAFNSLKDTTYLFGGSVPGDTAYGPSEFWEYIPNATDRDNGAGCTTATADKCKSKNCVDGVCCAQTAAECSGKCKSCNVAGKAGTCNNVPAGQPDETCPSDLACDATQQCKALLGHTCTSFTECASGNCTDGVCCNTACNGTCQQCNLAAKLGTCSPVPKDIEDPPTCASDPIQPRACDGAGVCGAGKRASGKPCNAGIQCTSGYCVDGFCCNTSCATACYTCAKPMAEGTCSALAAGEADHSATTPCDGPMQYCSGSGTCATNKKPNGGLCPNGASDCGSGFCIDGVCCATACLGTCQSCNVGGSAGTCVFAPLGEQDTNATAACTGAGMYCDGTGVCTSGKKANGASCTVAADCGSNFCVDGVCCESACTATCYTCAASGNGKCTGVLPGATDPNAATKCEAPNFCTNLRECTSGKKPNGATCTMDSDCGSNFCVDGTCCESSCSGPSNRCKSCKNATGSCAFAAAGTDLHNDCKGEMGCGGTCNGQGACAWAPAGKQCRTIGCQPDLGLISNANALCDGAGNCPVTDPRDCGGFGCYTDTNGGAQCKTDCSTDPDCAIRRYCEVVTDGGVADGGKTSTCPVQFPLGHACTRNPQCLSGTCAIPLGGTIGVCCNTACDHCGTCDSTGTCIPDPAGTLSATCADSASDPTRKCGGMCDGHAHCQYPAAGTACGTCKACDGVGLCNKTPMDDDTCGPIDCDGLNTSCMEYQDLTTNRCASLGACKAPNTVQSCTIFTNSCTPDGGAGGSAGGASGGRGGAGGGGAGTTGNDGGGATGGGGGGGCCAIGATPAPNALVGLAVLASVMIVRRRRR